MKEEQERTPLRTILQNFINHIESFESERIDDSYEKEFQELKFFSEILKTSKQYHCSEGEKEVNRKKNRYKDILPFDSSRVILEEYVGVPGSDYINANFIKGASGSPAYIASQGPLPHTVNDFWRMVVECEVQVIVMACNEEEAGKHKCENYWVEREGEEKQFGMVTIRLLKASIVCPDFLVRTMLLKYTNGQGATEERTVCQFHYSAWPDHGVPPLVRPLLDMVRLVRDTQASETLPVLVHCSAGCGRTGTICAIDYVFGLLRAGKLTKDFSLYTLVRDMRKQRIAMVQTKEQYVLVHQAVRELFCEQLRMIDAHPYENIDANGMPLIKEPTYDTIDSFPSDREENVEKQDGKEKEVGNNSVRVSAPEGTRAPPLPHKKKLHAAASKQEKEVENLTEKRRCTVERSSGSDSGSVSSGMGSLLSGPRIAKLKALFERNSTARESRNGRGRRRGSQQVTRSHSLGPVRKSEVDSKEEGLVNTTSWRPIPGRGILRVPQLVATAPVAKPALPVKRSKSLRVAGSVERRRLSVPVPDEEVSCDVVLVKQNKCVASVNSPSVSDKRPSVPPKALVKSRDVETSDYLRAQARTSREGILQRPSRGVDRRKEYRDDLLVSDWRSYGIVPAPLKRRHSLESVILDDVSATVSGTRADYVNVESRREFQNLHYMDIEARKLLQDCRDYLGDSNHSRLASKSHDDEQFRHLSSEARRKVKAIVAGLGVRERRNSFRRAVDTARVGGKLRDYETIWPGGDRPGGVDAQSWVQGRKDVGRPRAGDGSPSNQHLKSPKFSSAYGPKLGPECSSNSIPTPGNVERKVHRNHVEERNQVYRKPADNGIQFYDQPPKSLSLKGGGSLRVKGTQVLAFSREPDIDDSEVNFKNRSINSAESFEATKEHLKQGIRYNLSPPSGATHAAKIHKEVSVQARNEVLVAGGKKDIVVGADRRRLDQGVYVKRLPSDDRTCYQDLKSNGISPVAINSRHWPSAASSNQREDRRRVEATSKPNGTPPFAESLRVVGSIEVARSRSYVPLDRLSPRATVSSNLNPFPKPVSLSPLATNIVPERSLSKQVDTRTSRLGLAAIPREVEDQQRARIGHGTPRQTPRGAIQASRKAYANFERDLTDGTPTTTPLVQISPQGREEDLRKMQPTTSSPRDVYGNAPGFQQVWQGTQDDLTLCPNAPPRVRRHASVVLQRRSLQEANDPMLTVWNGSREDGDSWAAGAGVDVDTVAASIKRQPGDQNVTLVRALEALHLRKASQRNETEHQSVQESQGFTSPTLPVKKQHYL